MAKSHFHMGSLIIFVKGSGNEYRLYRYGFTLYDVHDYMVNSIAAMLGIVEQSEGIVINT